LALQAPTTPDERDTPKTHKVLRVT
jgi:hypothetical protein